MMLALAVIGGAFVVAAAGAQPASAATITRPDANTVVITSDRLDDITVHVTMTLTLRSNGEELLHWDVRNSGRNGKWASFNGTYNSAPAAVGWSGGLSCVSIDGNTSWSGGARNVDPELARQWNTVVSNPISVHFHLHATRTFGRC
jgi:hypothetical protein